MSPGSPEAAAPSSALGSVPVWIPAKLSGMPGAGAGSERSLLDGGWTVPRRASARLAGGGAARTTSALESLAQMAWLLLYVVSLPAMCRLQRNRLTPEGWGLRNPPGGKCSNRQEVSWSWAALLTHCDSEPLPGQSAPRSSRLAGRCVWGTGPTCGIEESVKGQSRLPLRIPRAHPCPAATGPVSTGQAPSGPLTFLSVRLPWGRGMSSRPVDNERNVLEEVKG